MKHQISIAVFLVFTSLPFACLAQDDWGTLTGKIALNDDGESPLRGAIVWLTKKKGVSLPIHPCMDELKQHPIELDIIDSRLNANLVTLTTGQELRITNRDKVGRGFVPITFGNESSSSIQPGKTQSYRFNVSDKFPGRLSDVADFRNSIPLLILDHPYIAATNNDGEFQLDLVPKGDWEFKFWHKDHGLLKDLNSDSASSDRRGRIGFHLKSDEQTFGKLILQTQRNAR